MSPVSVFSSVAAAGTSTSHSVGTPFTTGEELSLVLSSFTEIDLGINKGLSVTSGAGVGDAALSTPGDGVRGGSAMAVGELIGC